MFRVYLRITYILEFMYVLRTFWFSRLIYKLGTFWCSGLIYELGKLWCSDIIYNRGTFWRRPYEPNTNILRAGGVCASLSCDEDVDDHDPSIARRAMAKLRACVTPRANKLG